MVGPRTEEDKLTKALIKVILGGKEYEIKPLVIRDARDWRKQLTALLSRIPSYTGITTDDPAGFANAMQAMVVDMPDQMADLFFAYAKDLDRDEIEGLASEAELAAAVEQVLEVAFPLVQSLTTSLKRLAQ